MENEDDLIRRYLLGELADEEEQQRVEERLMTDDAFFERLKMAEDELVDEYLGGELPQWEHKSFERSFLTTPEGRQQVSFNTAFNRYVSEAAVARRQPLPVPPRHNAFTSLLAFFSQHAQLATGALVAACLLLIISAVLGVRVLQLHHQLDQIRASGQQGTEELQQQLAEERARSAQLDQELQRQKADNANLEQQIAKLSEQEHPETPPKEQTQRPFFALVLRAGTERGGGQNYELKLQPGVDSYKVKLVLEDASYPSYTATLLIIGGNETTLAGNLKPAGPRAARSITVNLPAKLLRRGDYRLRLYGPEPEREHVETYQFRVVE